MQTLTGHVAIHYFQVHDPTTLQSYCTLITTCIREGDEKELRTLCITQQPIDFGTLGLLIRNPQLWNPEASGRGSNDFVPQ